MSPRFPEDPEQRAARIAGLAARLARRIDAPALEAATAEAAPSPEDLERRIAGRLAGKQASAGAAGVAAASSGNGVAQAQAQAQARHIVGEGLGQARRLAQGDIRAADLSPATLANLEAVIRASGRPAWLVVGDYPSIHAADDTDDFWTVQATGSAGKMIDACRSVGCIFRDGDRTPIGTGWLIAPRTLVTNAHVAVHLARDKPGVGWLLQPGTQGRVDFGFERAGTRGPRLAVTRVLHVEPGGDPDIAVFRVETAAGEEPPPPLAIDLVEQRAAGWAGSLVFTVGHPVADLNDDANVQAVFGPLDATKRVSPGKVTEVLHGCTLAHDCSTTNGSSGSPLIDFATYQAVGLHYFGRPGDRNEAAFLAAIQDHPAIVRSLAQQWDA